MCSKGDIIWYINVWILNYISDLNVIGLDLDHSDLPESYSWRYSDSDKIYEVCHGNKANSLS